MSLYDIPINTLDGKPASLKDYEGKTVLLVNVASRCGLTPQYEGLERIHERYADRGFTVRRRPVQPVRRPGAGHRRGDPGVLLRDLRRDLPAHGEDRSQW